MCIVPGAYYFLLVFVCTIVQNTCCFCSATDLPFGSVCSTWLRFSSSHLQENNAKPKIRSNLNLRCKICHVYSCSMAGNPLLSVSYTDDFHLCSCSPFFFFPHLFLFLISTVHSLTHFTPVSPDSPDGAHSDESTPDPSQAIYAEFDDEFEEEELSSPIGQCTALYNFPGTKKKKKKKG